MNGVIDIGCVASTPFTTPAPVPSWSVLQVPATLLPAPLPPQHPDPAVAAEQPDSTPAQQPEAAPATDHLSTATPLPATHRPRVLPAIPV